MFTLILPKNRLLYQEKLDHMFKTRDRNGQGVPDPHDFAQSIYIVYEDPKRKLFGSCRVNPLSQSLLSQLERVHGAKCQDLKVMEVSRISFDEDAVLAGDPNEQFHTRWFFEGLGVMLETLSMTESIKGFFCISSPWIYQACKGLGEWSFLTPKTISPSKGHGPLHTGFLFFDKKTKSMQRRPSSKLKPGTLP